MVEVTVTVIPIWLDESQSSVFVFLLDAFSHADTELKVSSHQIPKSKALVLKVTFDKMADNFW